MENIDWTQKGAVTPVQQQGDCKSGYAFSAIGNIESVNFLFGSKKLVQLSVQQIIDCSITQGNEGCKLGHPHATFNYVISNGVTTDQLYPYAALQQRCKTVSGLYNISRYSDVASGSCADLANALISQPVSVGVDANNWQFYATGIFKNCGTNINHYALLVGATYEYWKVKNSWGTMWGESGYIRLKIGNACGICEQASYAILKF